MSLLPHSVRLEASRSVPPPPEPASSPQPARVAAEIGAVTNNVTGWSVPVSAVHRPTSVAEVQRLVVEARRDRRKLYPVSSGRNWGYGSSSPVTAGCELVDLGRMNRILNADDISVANPVAVIEPGVTQRQLHEFLQRRCPALTFNVTGAGGETSILGNALDRGVGYLGPRKEDVFGLEVVTGTGELLRTGFRRLGASSPLAYGHPYGLGPMLDGLFFQSNLGIVTSACFRLQSRRPKGVSISLALRRAEDLARFIDELTLLKRDGLLTSVTHVGNRVRTVSSLEAGMVRYLVDDCGVPRDEAIAEAKRAVGLLVLDEWATLASITGSAAQVRAAVKEIRRRTKTMARTVVLTGERLHLAHRVAHALRFIPAVRVRAAALSAVIPLHYLALGVPTDVAAENLLWRFGDTHLRAHELDRSRCGFLCMNPALPLDGAYVASFTERVKSIASTFGHELYITLNIETATSLVGVVNILFDRASAQETQRAHACSDAILSFMYSENIELYRARADIMSSIVGRDTKYWNTIRSLKTVFDPDDVIAPGRYNLTSAPHKEA